MLFDQKDNKSSQKKEFFTISQKVLDSIDEAEIKSTNVKLGKDNKLIEVDEKKLSEGDEILAKERLELELVIEKLGVNFTISNLIELVAESALRTQYANCEGLCMLFYALAEKYFKNTSIEIVISGENHMFIVIGRNKTSRINHQEEWGADCIVVDPWKIKERIMEAKYFHRLRTNKSLDPVYTKNIAAEFSVFYKNEYIETTQKVLSETSKTTTRRSISGP